MPSFVLGVDGGNTKTIALVARPDGTVVGAGRSGCGDIYGAISAQAACKEILSAVGAALTQASASALEVESAVFSMAGADWPEDVEFLRAFLAGRHLGRQLTVVNDAMGALRAGSPDGYGVSVVCGTGAATGARAPSGAVWHSGWWQGPSGSQELGQKALQAVFRADLGIIPATVLTPRVLAFFEANCVEEVIHTLTRRVGRPQFDSGKLGRLLMQTAREGDPVAGEIVAAHGAALGDYAVAAARRTGLLDTSFYLVLAGSVLKSGPSLLSGALVDRVRASAPAVRPLHSPFEPAAGALFLALESLGLTIDEPLLARLIPSLPAPSFFET